MSLPADYHMHTPLCRHAVGEPTELAAQAVKSGLKEIGFSDHAPMPRDDFDDWRMKSDVAELHVLDQQKYRYRTRRARTFHTVFSGVPAARADDVFQRLWAAHA